MSSHGKQVLVLATGTAIALTTVVLVQYVRRTVRRLCRQRLEQHIDDFINYEDLGVLALKAPQINLRRSAEQVILEKVTKSQFDSILKWCENVDDEELALKAVTVLYIILKNVNFKDLPDERRILSVIGASYMRSVHPPIYNKPCSEKFVKQGIDTMLVGVIFDIICDMEDRKMMLVHETDGILATILEQMQTTKSKEVMRYCLFIVHQICLNDNLILDLVDHGIVGIISDMLVKYWGDTVIQRICIQMLVVTINTHNIDDKKTLTEISEHNVIMHAVICLKSEEAVLVYWAVALLHEFAINEVCRDEICKLPYLIKNLQKALSAGQSNLQRLVLRVICFLALRNDPFKLSILNCNPIVTRLPVCLASGDKDVVHWALVLTHDLAMLGKAAVEKLLTTCEGIIKVMVPIARSQDTALVRLLAETLGFFCCCEQLQYQVVKAGLLTAVLYFAECQDQELTFWSSALLLNLAMTSDDIKAEILKCGGLQSLVDLCIGQFDNTQVVTMAAKTLSMLGFVDFSCLEVKVQCDSESASITVHGKPHYCNAPGINVMLWDTMMNEEAIYQNFSLEQYASVGDLQLDIPCLNANEGRNIGNIVFITVRGKHADAYLKGLKNVLLLDEQTSFGGVTTMNELDLPVNHTCVIVGTLIDDNKLRVKVMDKSIKASELELMFPYGDIVNQRVTNLVLLPTIDQLLNSPPNRSISRVSELELLEVLARHPIHKDVILSTDGFMQHLINLIGFCCSRGIEEFRTQPLPLAHCLGSLRVLASLTIHEPDCVSAGHLSQLTQQLESCKNQELEDNNLTGVIVALLFNITNLWIHSVIANATIEFRNFDRPSANRQVSETSDIFIDQSVDGNTEDQSEEREADLSASRHTIESSQSATESQDAFLKTAVITKEMLSEVKQKSPKITDSVQRKKTMSTEIDEFDDMFASLSRHCIVILGNLTSIQDKEISRMSREVLCQSGALHMLWCALLCSSGSLKFNITVPVVSTITRLSCTDWTPGPSYGMVLNPWDKTPALLQSGDCLEVRNDNWTFESILSNMYIDVTNIEELPAGWYYEVTLKSSGIMQIGWATKQCQFIPEKGLGVGDDVHSYAFDAARCKVWNGPITEQINNDYGTEWHDGDVISCLFHCDGSLSFWLKGVDLGVAFTDIDLTQQWYPACSLATDQQIRFNFGAIPFCHKMPDGFLPLSSISAAGSYLDHLKNIPPYPNKSATTKPSTAWWIPLDDTPVSHEMSPGSPGSSLWPPINFDVPSNDLQAVGQFSPMADDVTADGAGDRLYQPISVDVTSADLKASGPFSPMNDDVTADGAGDGLYQPIGVDITSEDLQAVGQFSPMGEDGAADGAGDGLYQPISVDVISDEVSDCVYHLPMSDDVTSEGAGDSQYLSISDDITNAENLSMHISDLVSEGADDGVYQPMNMTLPSHEEPDSQYPPISTGLASDDGNHSQYPPISRDLAYIGGGQGESHPPPSLYFEVCLTCNDERPISFGFRNMDDSQSVHVVVCQDNSMIMPDGDKIQFEGRYQVVLGCGLLLPPGACFFTVNGQPIKFLYTFYDAEVGQGPLLPYVSDAYVQMNVGETYFMYDVANEREIRLGMAALLHDYHESRLLANETLKSVQ